MGRRVLTLLRARLSGENRGTNLPIAAPFMHAFAAAILCSMVRDLPPFAYAVFALSAVGMLAAIPLLGELGFILRADPAQEWVSSLPVTAFDLKVARTMHLLIVLWWLVSGSLLAAALVAPAETGLAGRALLLAGGLGLVTLIGAVLLSFQSLVARRAPALLVLLQTLLMIGAVVGFVIGPELASGLADAETLDATAWLPFYPPAWFAIPLAGSLSSLWIPLTALALALAILAAAPAPSSAERRRGEPLLALFLRPARVLATRFWVRRDERAMFDLVYDALPLEREVVLRTYPLIGIPLAFLLLGSLSEGGIRDDLLAVVLFTASLYVPVLLLHVPASESHEASSRRASSPVSAGATRSAAFKAVAVRFLVPLYALLALVAWSQSGVLILVRLALPAFLVSLLLTRRLYATLVQDPPLSVAPDDVRTDLHMGEAFIYLAFGLTIGAVVLNKFLTPLIAIGLCAVLLLAEAIAERRLRSAVA
ncbi:MAG: hypothetical protein O7B99_10160 [Planctomycetota bacterium]|nr:hypothetical protein [Planctomycetota bacterium]